MTDTNRTSEQRIALMAISIEIDEAEQEPLLHGGVLSLLKRLDEVRPPIPFDPPPMNLLSPIPTVRAQEERADLIERYVLLSQWHDLRERAQRLLHR